MSNAKKQTPHKDTQSKSTDKAATYVILRKAQHWELEKADGGLCLSRVRDGEKPYMKFQKNFSKAVKAKIQRAVELELLDFTDHPEEYTIPSDTAKQNAIDVRYVSDELKRKDVQSNERIPSAPQFSTPGTMKAIGVSEEADRFIRLTNEQIKKRLHGRIANMNDEKAAQFLKDLYRLESKGMNSSFSPRADVVDLLDKVMLDRGIKPIAVSDIRIESDPDGDDSVLRLAL